MDSISPFITTVLVNGKQLAVGIIGQNETVFDKPMTPAEIQDVMYNKVQPFDVIQAVLQQEVVLYCGRLIATTPEDLCGLGPGIDAAVLADKQAARNRLGQDARPKRTTQKMSKSHDDNSW